MQFRGPVLARLAHDVHNMPLERDQTLWRLHSDTTVSWKCLEDALVYILNTLMNEAGVPVPLDFGYFALPSTKGYLRSHGTADTAMRCASRSRDTFVPLMAMCSMAISLVNCKDHDATTGSRPLWMQLLKDSSVSMRHGWRH